VVVPVLTKASLTPAEDVGLEALPLRPTRAAGGGCAGERLGEQPFWVGPVDVDGPDLGFGAADESS
jgi:hypothetical protein